MLMNTSFNLANAPIVETPADAARCFLDADPDLSLLLLGNTLLRRRKLSTPLPKDAIPTQQAAIVSRTVADATGEARSVEILVDDRWLPLSTPFALAVLEACDGSATVGEIAGEIAALQAEAEAEVGWSAGTEGEEEGAGAQGAGSQVAEAVEQALRELYRLRLVSLECGDCGTDQ
jgi:hypothetical protein